MFCVSCKCAVTMNSKSIWIVAILGCMLFSIVSVAIVYFFWYKRKNCTKRHFYVLKEKKAHSPSLLSIFRHIGEKSVNKNENCGFTSDNLPIVIKDNEDNCSMSDSTYSMSEKFEKAVLAVSNCDSTKKDDLESCISDASSKRSFYSTFTRQNSQAETYVSID